MVDSIRVFDPAFRLLDDSGAPVSGGKAKFYNAGGLVARTVYSNSGLSASLGSTVTTNSEGVFCASAGAGDPVLIYTGTTAYKIIFTDSSDNELGLEFDNITGALDTSAFGLDTAIPRTPVVIKSSNYTILDADRGDVINADPTGGSVTLTLPSAITVGDDWRVTIRHNGTANTVVIEGVSSQTINGALSLTLTYQFESVTLVSDGANWHVAEDAFIRTPAGAVTPQGYLTLVPEATDPVNVVSASDQSSKTSVYYRPYRGNLLPLYDGIRFVPYEFDEQTLTLVSQHEASKFYDVFAFLDGTTLRIGTGPVWSTLTAGAGARGTGAATTQISRVNGILVNTVAITARNGTSTYSVAANRATYLGSIFIDGSAGQVSCHRSYGQARKWGVWNAYNRLPVRLRAGDPAASWVYETTTIRAANGSSDNAITVFTGLREDSVRLDLIQIVNNANNVNDLNSGIGVNSTTAISGFSASVFGAAATSTIEVFMHSNYEAVPPIGVNTYTILERGGGNTETTWFGTHNGHVMTAQFNA